MVQFPFLIVTNCQVKRVSPGVNGKHRIVVFFFLPYVYIRNVHGRFFRLDRIRSRKFCAHQPLKNAKFRNGSQNEEYEGCINLKTRKENWTIRDHCQRKVLVLGVLNYSDKTTPCSSIGSDKLFVLTCKNYYQSG